MKTRILFVVITLAIGTSALADDAWVIDSQDDWVAATAKQSNLEVKEGVAVPSDKVATFASKVQRFDKQRKASSIVLDQSPIWQNWNPVPNLGPANLQDAPVFLQMGDKNYWAFGRYGTAGRGKKPQPFKPAAATLEGFDDVKLQTTPWPNQFNAPGGQEKGLGGYHAWQSRDMVNWVHHGPVTEGFSRWVTSAEQVDGKVYIYYDYPNDQDPHVYVDEDLTDGKPGKNLGIAFEDPSDGSDAGFIRDRQGKFHVIYEDWSPIDANKRSWDSPLAGHAVSDGPTNFKVAAPAVDNRTKPTGKFATYKHPHWAKEDPKRFKTGIAKYEIHAPEQEAYGDWAAIAVGGQYYIFGDYDPVGGHQMAVGWFTSSDINKKQFKWCDKIGNGHPDPDVGFANGKFYLWTQQKTDYTSPGPWVEKVEARVGVDTDNDGKLDKWTAWQEVKETYDYREGFSKQVNKTAAKLDLNGLPAGFGFGFEFRMTDTTKNKAKPMMDKVTLEFE
jgi:hypothetical protein